MRIRSKSIEKNSRNIIGRNPSIVIPSLANQDLTPTLIQLSSSVLSVNDYFDRRGTSYSVQLLAFQFI